jgi:hypothetical protein
MVCDVIFQYNGKEKPIDSNLQIILSILFLLFNISIETLEENSFISMVADLVNNFKKFSNFSKLVVFISINLAHVSPSFFQNILKENHM